MKIFYPFIIIILLFPTFKTQSQNDTLVLFRNSYTPFELTINDFGVFRDTELLNGDNFHPASTAVIGKGLIAICIAKRMGWISKEDAEALILKILKTVTGNNSNFNFIRNDSGYPLHWFNMETGEPMWSVEYSTIDAALLTSGALFAKKFFCDNDSIGFYADSLWNSTDWSKSIQDSDSGGIFRLMNEEGEGIPNSITLPFNEYMIVAWLAVNQAGYHPDSAATQLWNKHYANPDSLLIKQFEAISLLTDHPDHFLSSFVIQFTYYHCHYFTTNNDYLSFFENARKADSLSFTLQGVNESCKWGLGGGHCDSAPNNDYCVLTVNNNPLQIYSPHIISGFLPIYPNGITDLIKLFNEGKAVYEFTSVTDNNLILWRKSLVHPDWESNQVQLVDFSTMLFGLAEYHLGGDFFKTYNNYFEDTPCVPCPEIMDNTTEISLKYEIDIYPNPTNSFINFTYESGYNGVVLYIVYNQLGQIVKDERLVKENKTLVYSHSVEGLNNGVYYLRWFEDGLPTLAHKIVVQH